MLSVRATFYILFLYTKRSFEFSIKNAGKLNASSKNIYPVSLSIKWEFSML